MKMTAGKQGKPGLLIALAVIALAIVVISTAGNPGVLRLAKLAILVTVIGLLLVYIPGRLFGAQRARKIIVNLFLFAVVTGVCLVAAEFLVRYLYSDVTTTGDNKSYFANRWREEHPPVTNGLGYREREFPVEKPADTYRIIVVGDSLTYGQGILDEERFTNIIGGQLADISDTYEVLNFGRPGDETVDHLATLDRDVIRSSPDFVLLQWFINDVEGDDKSGRPGSYRLVPSYYLSHLLFRHSALYFLLNSSWNELQEMLGLTESYLSYMERRFGDPESRDSLRADAEIEEFVRRLKAREIPTGIVLFPPLEETGGDVGAYPYGFLFDRVLAICRQEAITCLDLRPVFAGISPASGLWANRLDSHPGPLANRLAAEAIMHRYLGEWQPRD